jgi:hypothetical protein
LGLNLRDTHRHRGENTDIIKPLMSIDIRGICSHGAVSYHHFFVAEVFGCECTGQQNKSTAFKPLSRSGFITCRSPLEHYDNTLATPVVHSLPLSTCNPNAKTPTIVLCVQVVHSKSIVMTAPGYVAAKLVGGDTGILPEAATLGDGER